MRRVDEGFEAAITAACAAARAGGGDPEGCGALRTWLILAAAALCASARGVARAPAAHEIERAVRGSRGELARAIEDGIAALIGSDDGRSARPLDGLPVSPGDVERGVRALLDAMGARDDLAPLRALDEAALGATREAGLTHAVRRVRGAHSTPRALADAVAEDGLEALAAAGGDAATARIFDPAAGGAALLLAVGRRMLARLPEAARAGERAAIAQRLHGVERDGQAAAIARAAIALWGAEVGRPSRVSGRQIATGDVLLAIDDAEIDALLEGVRGPAPGSEAARALRRDAADALVDGFFAPPAAGRSRERAARIDVLRGAARGDGVARDQLARWAAGGRARGAVHPTLVWNDAPGFELALLNPPFLGGKRIATVHGEAYAAWLAAREPEATGNADLAAHVLLATRRWLAPRAAIAIVATNALVSGATRHAALERLLAEGHGIVSAWRSARWPGVAAVNVVRVAMARGAAQPFRAQLDGARVVGIDAGLRPARRRAPPRALQENEGLAFVGFFLRGEGFVIAPDEARALLARDPRNAACLRPYLVGEDVLRDPSQLPARFVVDFGARSLEEARQFPELLALVDERVRPVREALAPTSSNRTHRRAWWRFANPRPSLREALAGRTRCLVAPRVGKHLAFTAVPADMVFSEQLVVVACDAPGRLGVLASCVHDAWARAHSSSLQSGLRYLPSRAFATFPFPAAGAMAGEVDRLAGELVRVRHAATHAHRMGLTMLRDRIDARGECDALVLDARRVQEALDGAVLRAFGWGDLELPPRGSSAALREDFEQQLLDRLADENERRAGQTGGRVV